MLRVSRVILPMLLALSIWPAHAAAAATAPFDGWTFRGTVVSGNAVQLAPSSAPLACAPEDVDGGGAAYDPTIGLCRGDSGVFGVMTGPRTTSADSFQQLVGSWNAVTPPGTWLELHARLLQAPGWSGWYSLGVWASDGSTIQRHSVPNQADDRARVETDTLIAADGLLAGGYQLAVTLYAASPDVTPAVRLVTAATTSQSAPAQRLNSGVELTVPKRSQMHPEYQGLGFGGGGEAWCSPTSTSMLMAYWANILNLPQLNLPVPQVAAGTYDQAYNGAGNWPFNMALAGSLGLTAYVARFASFDQIEPWVRAGVPIAISIAFRPGELPGAPIPSSPGHWIVVRGFTQDGNVIVNDPAAPTDDQVRMIFDRAALQRVWQRHSLGTAYVVYPPGWQVPT